MRILMLNYEFPPLGSGAANANYYILRELARFSNLQIDLITGSPDKEKIEQFSPLIKIYKLNIGKKNKNLQKQTIKNLLIYSYLSYKLAKKLIKKNNYNLTHAFFGIPCGYIALKLKLPYIVSLRGSDVPFYSKKYLVLDILIFKNLSKLIWRNAKNVIANSEMLKKLALNSSPQQKIEIIPNGIDANKFYPAKQKNNIFNIISVCSLKKRKGLEYLINGFYIFHKKYSNSKLTIIGFGEEEDKLKKITNKLNINNAVFFLGSKKHNDLPKFYQNASVFVLPSLNEGMSNSLLEAIASGLPIITTDVGGTQELIEKNGIIVKKENAIEIADGLEKIYQNKMLRHKMGEKSREISKKMGWGVVTEKYYKIYKNICAE